MERLPRELVADVLSRLTAKELMRCKCVCKSWYDLIINPYFISNYYLLYNSREEQLLVFRDLRSDYNREGDREQFYDAEISILSWKLEDIVSSRLLNHPPYKRWKYWGVIMGTCNGIYFLEGDPNIIMNPSLRQFITLPESNFTAPHGTYSNIDYPCFGFDPETNDYKVVVLKDLWLDETNEPLMGDWIVELYSFNSNSWRNLGDKAITFPFVVGHIWGFCTYVNNCCHWRGHVYRTKDDVVLSFDMVTELFRKIKVPQIIDSHSPSSHLRFKYLAAFTESSTIGFISLPAFQETEDYYCFDVWMMKDYWDDESWIKRYSVRSMPTIYRHLVGLYDNNCFLWKDANDTLVLYGLDCEEHTGDLWVYGKDASIRAVRYMESLVSLRRGN